MYLTKLILIMINHALFQSDLSLNTKNIGRNKIYPRIHLQHSQHSQKLIYTKIKQYLSWEEHALTMFLLN